MNSVLVGTCKDLSCYSKHVCDQNHVYVPGSNTTVLVHSHEGGYFHLECRAYVAYFLNFDVLLHFKIKLTDPRAHRQKM